MAAVQYSLVAFLLVVSVTNVNTQFDGGIEYDTDGALKLTSDKGVVAYAKGESCKVSELCATKADVGDVQSLQTASDNLVRTTDSLNITQMILSGKMGKVETKLDDVDSLQQSQKTEQEDLVKKVSNLMEGMQLLNDTLREQIEKLTDENTMLKKSVGILETNMTTAMTELETFQKQSKMLEESVHDLIVSTTLSDQIKAFPDPRLVKKVIDSHPKLNLEVPKDGLELWLSAEALLDANTNEGTLDEWKDMSGNGRHAKQTDEFLGRAQAFEAPVFKKSFDDLNGFPAVSFPNAESSLLIPEIPIKAGDPRTMIIALHHETSSRDVNSEFFGIGTANMIDLGNWCPSSVGSNPNYWAGVENIRLRTTLMAGNSIYTRNGVAFHNRAIVITVVADESGVEVFVNGEPEPMSAQCSEEDGFVGEDSTGYYTTQQAFHWDLSSTSMLGNTGFLSRGFIGEIGDFMIYSKALNRTERYLAEVPLLAKYLRKELI